MNKLSRLHRMNEKLFDQTKEAFVSVLPITIIVLLLDFTVSPMPFSIRISFLIGSALLVLGMGFFSLGADIAMMPMGEHVGAQLTKSKKMILLVGVSFVMGTIVTIAEPDLQVLAGQFPSIPKMVLVWSVAFGVGIFLVISLLRILYQWNIAFLFIGFYILIFGVGAFTSADFVAVAFDSGGVTTGPITVPFILALGVGISSVRGGKSSHDDSFGLLGLCSVGPVLGVIILGLFYKTPSSSEATTNIQIPEAENLADIWKLFETSLPVYFKEVALSLLPIIAFFLIFQILFLRLPKSQMIKLTVGVLYTYFGLAIFLAGVNVGFLPMGAFLGEYIAGLSYQWILIPLGIIMGFFIVAAEPAVHVLNNQVEDITGGAISKKAMLFSLSIGVAVSTALALLRVLYGISIWYFLVPSYVIALILSLFVPKIFIAIAFDSGGVASGTMAATFLLPFATGVCLAVGGNILTDAFGIIAMVAMTPLITIQVMGLIYKIKLKNSEEEEDETIYPDGEGENSDNEYVNLDDY